MDVTFDAPMISFLLTVGGYWLTYRNIHLQPQYIFILTGVNSRNQVTTVSKLVFHAFGCK